MSNPVSSENVDAKTADAGNNLNSENVEQQNTDVAETEKFAEIKNDCSNMGSKSQAENSVNMNHPEGSNLAQADSCNQDLKADQAEQVLPPVPENLNSEQNDERNIWAASKPHEENSPPEEINQSSEAPNNAVVVPEEKDMGEVNNCESNQNLKEAVQNKILPKPTISADEEATWPPMNSEPVRTQELPRPMSPEKNVSNQYEDGSPEKNYQGGNSRKQNLPKRALRERKLRSTKNNDPMSKCHICDKNSLR